MTRVFTDASSAILLQKSRLFEPFSTLFSVIFAPSVFREITRVGYPGADAFIQARTDEKVLVQAVDTSDSCFNQLSSKNMDRGETDTLALYLKNKDFVKKAGVILTDDGKAARWCDKNNAPFINALLVPKLFWYAGHMTETECSDYMETLCHIGRYSKKVKAFAFDCTQKKLSLFIPFRQKNEPDTF